VIAVDLDGTLTRTDTLHESVIGLLRENPIAAFAFPFWLSRGKACLKDEVAKRFVPDAALLPYNEQLLEWLKAQKGTGRSIVLCTAANERIAHAVASHLQLFDSVIASGRHSNVRSNQKRVELVQRFGHQQYDYAGNSSDDLEVWSGANQAIVVNAKQSLVDRASRVCRVAHVFPSPPATTSAWLKLFRVHQWVKNLLLFVPLITGHQFGDLTSLATLTLAFVLFSMLASAVYMVNDLIDLEPDRKHPRKRRRPLASAEIPVSIGVLSAPAIVIGSLSLGFTLSKVFFAFMLVYLVATCAYSLWLKRLALVDCLTLASLYTLRIIAGGAAVGVTLSFWLIAFSVFIFLSLAFVKRYAELRVQTEFGQERAPGRGYVVGDAQLLQTLGVAAGYAAVLVLALYLQGETVTKLYAQPEIIWFAVPLTIFWVSWIWLQAHLGKMHDDPVVFAISDRTSLLVAGLGALLLVLATKGLNSWL